MGSIFTTRPKKTAAVNKHVFSTILYAVLTFISIILLLPLLYLITTSFKTLDEVLGPLRWFAAHPNFKNYRTLFELENFHIIRFFLNTMFLYVMKVTGTIITCSLAAYGFVRFNVKFKGILFALLLTVIMMPAELLTIPLFEAYINLDWMDSYKPMYISSFFGADIFMLFLFRQFFLSVPKEIFKAAEIDGASEIQMFARIMLPLTKPVIVTCLLIYFTGTYNDIYGPTLYISSEEKFTLAQGIRYIQSLYNTGVKGYIIPWNIVSAATVLAILPVMFIFFIFQKQFVEGVSKTGIKG